MIDDLTTWLVTGEPWIEYRTRLDLLGQREDDEQVEQAYHNALDHPQIRNIITELSDWPGPILKSHKKAGHNLHKLVFLADIGLKTDEPIIQKIVQQITEYRSPEGPFQVLVNIKPRYGGTGEDQLAWMLCDAPLVLYALVRFGSGDSPEVQDALHYLLGLTRDNGWTCTVSASIGKFRGPGRKDDPCPYANLVMLRLLSQFPELHSDPAVETGVDTLLTMWENRKERRPYLFAMGTDFAKIKAPMVWYDILHISDVLSQFQIALADERFHQLITVVKNKADEDGKFTAKSIWMDWKGWEFGQKKEPSRWITLLAHRMLQRSGMIQRM